MNERKFRKGDIVLNKWAGTPQGRYFIFVHMNGNTVTGIHLTQKGAAKEDKYNKRDVLTGKLPNGEYAYEVIGHTDGFEVLKNDLKLVVKEDTYVEEDVK